MIQQHQTYKGRIVYISFRTIHFYLAMSLRIKELLPSGSTYILCAAVSDFIPESTPDHKIHTSDKLDLKLIGSPKILGRLVREDVLTVSFKLETDEQKL
jgi:phosphopantothenoylcysteine synthetase/decarboxylase